MTPRDLIVIGASAGGVEALCELVVGLPDDLPAAVLVVLHMRADSASALAHVLDRSGPLPAAAATGDQRLRQATITVAPPDHHLLVTDTGSGLSRGITENGYRPAVNILFRSAATHRGRRVIGVQLSGALDDGAAGMVAIARAGGTTVVQAPGDALHPGMPTAVLDLIGVDHVVAARESGPLLGRLAGTRAEGPDPHVAALDEGLERALWAAHHLLAEKAGLAGRLEGAAGDGGLAPMHRRHGDIAHETSAAAATLRRLLLDGLPAPLPASTRDEHAGRRPRGTGTGVDRGQ